MKYYKIIAIVIAIVSVSACVSYIAYANLTISIDQDTPYQVVSVIDGDTFRVKIGWHIVTIRMLGIDTPETVDPRKPEQCYGHEASDETKRLLVGGIVHLRLNPDREEKDKYNRYLAYVYLENELFVNEYLLKNGFAREYTYGKAYLYQKEFRGIEKEAKEERLGLWGVCRDTSFKSTKS